MKKMILALATSLIATGAFAQEAKSPIQSEAIPTPNHEVGGGTSSGLGFDSNSFVLSADISYMKFITPEWELGGSAAVYIYSGTGNDFHNESLSVGARYNLLDAKQDVQNAPFVDAFLGTFFADDIGANFFAKISAGKRFALTSTISYSPNINYSFTKWKSSNGHEFGITLLNFTLLF